MRRLPDARFFLPDMFHERRRAERARRAVAATRDVLVVSHKNCLDGVGSYLVHALALDSPPPVVYGHPADVSDILFTVAAEPGDGRTVSVNDLSIDKKGFDRCVQAAAAVVDAGWSLVWRDHHHKQWEGVDLSGLEAAAERLVVDRHSKECGTSLAQQDLLPDDDLARGLADIVRDRDLWWNQDPRGERYEFALREMGTEAFVTRFLAARDLDAHWIDEAADARRRRSDEEAETAVYACERFGPDDEVAVIYGDVPKNVTQHRIREVHGTRVEINIKPEGRFSARSAKGADICHLLGQAYGGGGHPNAAGGVVPVPVWEWPLFWAKGGLSPAGMSVVKTAVRLVADADGGEDPKDASKRSR